MNRVDQRIWCHEIALLQFLVNIFKVVVFLLTCSIILTRTNYRKWWGMMNLSFSFSARKWPFRVTLIPRCWSLDVNSTKKSSTKKSFSKKSLPKPSFVKILWVVLQRVENFKYLGYFMFLLHWYCLHLAPEFSKETKTSEKGSK